MLVCPPDGDRRVDPPVLSGRVPGLPSTPKDEAGLTRKFETRLKKIKLENKHDVK